jgi:hypothetical protein
MRKEYGKALRDIFAERMRRDHPEWTPVAAPKPWYWSGERLYVQQRGQVWLVLVLQPNLKDHESFHIEVGWSRLGRVPELAMRPSFATPGTPEALACEEYVCRLSELVPAAATSRDLSDGWVVEPLVIAESVEESVAVMAARLEKIGAGEARARVGPHLQDAFRVLVAYGIPYLEESLAGM